MIKLIETYNRFDVVVIPFPFVDSKASKKRPALIISSSEHFKEGSSVMAMITSALHTSWPLDVSISSLEDAGLSTSSIIRMKLFTLDHKLILRKIGTLAKKDSLNFSKKFHLLIGKKSS